MLLWPPNHSMKMHEWAMDEAPYVFSVRQAAELLDFISHRNPDDAGALRTLRARQYLDGAIATYEIYKRRPL